MTDVLGWRKKFGVIMPSTNTVAQPDMDRLRPPGVTNHFSRIGTINANATSNEAFYAASTRNYVMNEKAEMVALGPRVAEALDIVMTCKPDHIVVAQSSHSFRNGLRGAANFRDKMQERSGIAVSIGSFSMTAALKAYGGVKRIAFLTPYFPIANVEVRKYFTDEGFEVVDDIALQAPSWTGIAEITPQTLIETIKRLDGPKVDAIVQSGTNCSMVAVATAAEMWLGKPVIPVNVASYWHALRTTGITDKVYGYGRLLEEF
jgi:maleate isomerase